MSALAIVEPSQDLAALAFTANTEHLRAAQSAADALGHAIRAGEALMEARMRCEEGRWMEWLDENFNASQRTAQGYMRLAMHAELVRERLDSPSLGSALTYLRGLPRSDDGRSRIPDYVRQEVAALKRAGHGIREIAETTALDESTVSCILDPAERKRRTRNTTKARSRRRKERDALKRAERDRLARKTGGTLADGYSLVRRAAQELERAEGEAVGREAKTAVRAAIGHLHRAEDEIGTALAIAYGKRDDR